MNGSRFDTWTRRRFGLAAGGFTVAALLGLAEAEDAAAKTLCRKNGVKCKKKSKKCQPKFCLRAPFTIEARWSNDLSDHDTYLFVPGEAGSNDPSPWIAVDCRPSTSHCEDAVHPFTCVNQDAQGPGNEITTVRRLLAGAYEYWIELDFPSPTGDVEVILRNANGRVMGSWSSPKNVLDKRIGWHVFDLTIAGATRSITAVDEVTASALPFSAHSPATNACPWVP